MEKYSRLIQFSAGLTSIVFGVLVYVIDRPSIYIPSPFSNISLYHQESALSFGSFSNNMPSFFHTFSFCLFLSCINTQRKIKYTQITIFWLLIEISFEFMQAPAFSEWLEQTQFCKDDSGYIFFNICAFIKNGYFDTADVVASFLGAALAYSVMLITTKEKKNVKISK